MNLAQARPGSVGGLTLVSRVARLCPRHAACALLGAGFASDAFFVAFRLPNMFRALFAEGAFSAGFVPMFSQRLQGGGGEARPRTSPRRRSRCSCRSDPVHPGCSSSPLAAVLSRRSRDRRPSSRLRGPPVADHLPLSAADQPRLAVSAASSTARRASPRRLRAGAAQPRDDRRAVVLPRRTPSRRRRSGALGHGRRRAPARPAARLPASARASSSSSAGRG